MSVLMIQEPNRRLDKNPYDITPALVFGEVRSIFKAGEQPGQCPVPAKRRVHLMLGEFSPDNDYILWAGGDPYGLALVSAMLIERFGSYNFLRWERDRNKAGSGHYIVVPMTA